MHRKLSSLPFQFCFSLIVLLPFCRAFLLHNFCFLSSDNTTFAYASTLKFLWLFIASAFLKILKIHREKAASLLSDFPRCFNFLKFADIDLLEKWHKHDIKRDADFLGGAGLEEIWSVCVCYQMARRVLLGSPLKKYFMVLSTLWISWSRKHSREGEGVSLEGVSWTYFRKLLLETQRRGVKIFSVIEK